MRYTTTVNKQVHEVTLNANSSSHQQTVTLDSKPPFPIDCQHISHLSNNSPGGHFNLLIAGRSYDIHARRLQNDKTGQTYEIIFSGYSFEVRIEDERARLLAKLTKSAPSSSTAQIIAPMPGLVVNTPVAIGDTVTAGQTVLVLEAMKMENDLSTPLSGVVKELYVQKGQTVEQNAVLVVISAEKVEKN